VLEDFGLVAGPNIPIIVTFGKRWFVDNIERCMGHVRLAKDAQRIANMQRSKLAEISALSSVEKPLFDPEQVAGHQWMWEQDNLRNFPYLLLNRLTNIDGSTQPAGPLGYTKPPQVPPALAALIQIAEQDMRDVLGGAEGGDQVRANVSAEAVGMVQQRLDMQTFIYVSNFAKAMKRCGEVWLGMAREVYVEEGRSMKTVGPEGGATAVELLKPTIGEAGGVELQNDLSRARFDVTVTVGPSSQSKRNAMVRSLTPLIAVTADPATKAVLESIAIMNIEGEGMTEVRAFVRKKLVQMGAMKPTEEEAKEMAAAAQQQQPDPQTLYLQAAAAEAQAKAMKAQADTQLAIANAEKTKAETVKTLASVNISAQNQAIKTAEAIGRATSA
jgi:hypothetical protein